MFNMLRIYKRHLSAYRGDNVNGVRIVLNRKEQFALLHFFIQLGQFYLIDRLDYLADKVVDSNASDAVHFHIYPGVMREMKIPAGTLNSCCEPDSLVDGVIRRTVGLISRSILSLRFIRDLLKNSINSSSVNGFCT